jgi:hypothetical protein
LQPPVSDRKISFAPSRSGTLAAVTTTTMIIPKVSNKDMALASLDALGGIIAFDARQSRRFNALAV